MPVAKTKKSPKVTKAKKSTTSPKKEEPKDEISQLLLPQIREYFQQKLGFKKFTPVQVILKLIHPLTSVAKLFSAMFN